MDLGYSSPESCLTFYSPTRRRLRTSKHKLLDLKHAGVEVQRKETPSALAASTSRMSVYAKSAQPAESSSSSAVQRGRSGRSSGMRYVRRSHYMEGDRVIACVCDQRLGSWRHGVVANLERYPPRNEGRGQLAYPVLYQSGARTVMGYFNPFLCEMLYDTLRNSIDHDIP
ncbi:hypothetical protein OH76DRAFT_293890 [Lentinus brumalis]|uniref:Uncharacterized protein n=1 Tax=Lentinus brumalis TaxID=2498619 RepID=A0A371DG41_9APHY|nr:hypothetical protein OH76DRAFT_293890 [Polyporus brumalis]